MFSRWILLQPYSDTGLTASTAYNYSVIAKDAAGNASSASSVVSVTTLACGGSGNNLYYNLNGSTTSYIESEKYTAKTGTFIEASCSACSGGIHMETPNGSSDSDTNYVRYDLQVTNGGSFYIYLLSQSPDSSSDSFYVAVDSGSNNQVTTGGSSWAWKKPSASISLSTGAHTLYIKVREDGARVDKIALSKSSSTPSGLGGATLIPAFR